MFRNDIHRIIDANINRAGEALRVLEDFARFSNVGAVTCELRAGNLLNEKLKSIRHEINKIFSKHTNLILNRDSQNDIGRYIENTSKKKSLKDLIHANCKRSEESLRVLSEYGQLLQIEEVEIKKLEDFRYEIYTIEKELLISEKLVRLNNSKLYLVTCRDALAGRLYDDKIFLSIIEKAIDGGVDIIQLREKNEREGKILELAKEIKKLISGTDVLFIINDRVDLALASEADGVHLGQDDMPVTRAREITPDGFIIGLSTHSIVQGKVGLQSGADYLGVGPVFSTPTKPDYKPCGLEYVAWARENLKEIPWFAIGGINETNIDKVIEAGGVRIAVVRSIMSSEDPFELAKNLREKLTGSMAKML